ncbi:MAG: outer membrane beta-barrel protein [Alphaproteobacteria bacterium]|nr:outer membrane beta-barrel protein [Alphaproteobacteria bacterium]
MLKTNLSLIAGLSAVALLSTANVATAATAGTYAGVSVGYARNDTKLKLNNLRLSNKKATKFNSVPAGVHFGWERNCPHQLFTAAELGLDFTGRSRKTTLVNGNPAGTAVYKVEKGFSMDLALKAGYSFGTIVPYVRLGLTGTNWTQKVSATNYLIPNTTSRVTGNFKKRKFIAGFAPGAGIQAKLGTSRWTTGVEYKFIAHGKHTVHVNAYTGKIKSRTHDVRARLSYGF